MTVLRDGRGAGVGEQRCRTVAGEEDAAIVSFKPPPGVQRHAHAMHAIAAVTLGLFLCAVGISHFAFPAYFRKLVPSRLPRPGLLVAGSGIAEMVIGAGLVLPITRELAGLPALALLSVYLLVWVRHTKPCCGRWSAARIMTVQLRRIADLSTRDK
ncbi:DoxX family protein [Nocardia otitidiscaviarum]|uniref:DoxX family protein n=1 Tax=Nocardia otitidiscaviarum TaxID=1823 RepID=UPI001893832A|nr:hypothetical protein [Nocardia otitidiscaviarum]MBF6177506.1 hypothetical protein [Nocardia otitidiscaviarum]